MTPDELIKIGEHLFGKWGWQTKLARALQIDSSTVRRWVSGTTTISGSTKIALLMMSKEKDKENAYTQPTIALSNKKLTETSNANIQKIVQMKFGSHLYGTSTPNSDLDIKGIYIPASRDILLQSVQSVISFKRAKSHGEKNTSDDVDHELYSPEKFLRLLAEGQIVALDMLFAPKSLMLSPPNSIWQDIKKLAHKIFNKKTASFVRYCKQQANKYGIKGSRVAAARKALALLSDAEKQYKSSEKLAVIGAEIKKIAATNEFLCVGEVQQPNGNMVSYFEICGKKALFNSSIKIAKSIAQRLMDEYGERALAAEKNEGIDWKALSHAVRVGRQAIEFLSTHKITFPRPEAAHLVDIKQGKLTFKEVAEEIETLLEDVETAAEKSTLVEKHDERVINDFIEKLHEKIIIENLKQ